jgi:hypothetical protein
VHVEADDALDLLDEGGIVGAFDGSQTVGRELMGLSDALDRGERQARGFGHSALVL